MISTNAELFDLVEAFRTALHNAGYQRWSDALADAMSISTVPGEILGETRLELRNLEATNIPDVLEVKRQLKEALSYLNGVLRESK